MRTMELILQHAFTYNAQYGHASRYVVIDRSGPRGQLLDDTLQQRGAGYGLRLANNFTIENRLWLGLSKVSNARMLVSRATRWRAEDYSTCPFSPLAPDGHRFGVLLASRRGDSSGGRTAKVVGLGRLGRQNLSRDKPRRRPTSAWLKALLLNRSAVNFVTDLGFGGKQLKAEAPGARQRLQTEDGPRRFSIVGSHYQFLVGEKGR